uniref:RING-type E3 ubiquitin transferase n=1 Tax=Oryza meridionalis TaxID=40149 RepID=A0A0E0D3K1_9ORYZ
MGSVLCCLADDGRPVCCFCLPWPIFNAAHNHNHNSGSIARPRADTRVAPDQGRISLTAPTQHDSMDTFRCPPRPLPWDDPRFSHRKEHHPLVGGHDKASTTFDKSGSLGESKNADSIPNSKAVKDDGPSTAVKDDGSSTAVKDDGSSIKHHSDGLHIGKEQVHDLFDFEDDCPICLEEYDYENPKMTLQCNHNFHLCCIYEWMERSQACPVCSKVMLFHEDA